MKYKVLIADDELWIRKWLVKIIGTIRSDIEIIAAVDNGKEALDIIKSTHVDILVTDIHMPIMTGLELAELVKDTKVIMISGYDEFEYARKAIKLQVMGYLLKPIEKTELKEVLDKTITSIQNEGSFNIDEDAIDHALKNLFNSYVKNKDINSFHKAISFAETLNVESMIVGEVQFDIGENNLISLKDFFEEEVVLVYPNAHFYLINESSLRYKLIILLPYKNVEKIFMLKQWLIEHIQKKFVSSRVLLSQSYKGIELLSEGFDSLEKMRLQMMKNPDSGESKQSLSGEVMYAIRSSMLLAIKSNDHNTFINHSNQIKDRIEKNDYNLEEIRMFIFGLVSDIIKNIEETDGDYRNKLIAEGYDFCVKIQNYTNVLSMLIWVENYAGVVIEYLNSNQYSNVKEIVERVRKHLLIHYSKDISLSVICDKFGVNRSYFSKRFKEESGMNFSDMLTNIRLDAATQLIVSTNMSLVDISESVGFNDPKYFSRVFRKHYGMTPSQYREKH